MNNCGRHLRPVGLVLLVAVFILDCAQAEPAQTTQPGPVPAQTNPPPAEVDSFPAVVARVNQTEIGKAELLGRVKAVQGQMGFPAGPMPLEFYRIVLKELIGIELLFQGSQALELAASTEEVSRQFDEFKSQFPDEASFSAQLAEQGVTSEQLRQLVRKDLSVQKLIDARLMERVLVTEESKRAFYEKNIERMQEPERLKLNHILAQAGPEASDELRTKARERLEQLREELVEGGADFTVLAREHSEDPDTKASGGEMIITRGQTVAPFEKAAFSLEPGAISPVVETTFGYHLIRLSERMPSRQVPYEEAAPQIQEFLQQQGLQEEIESEVETLRADASIETFI